MSNAAPGLLAVALAAALGGCGTATPSTATPTASGTPSPAISAVPTRLAGVCGPVDVAASEPTKAVRGSANIFGAGTAAPPAPGGGGGGTLPPFWEVPSDATVVTFPIITGKVSPLVNQPLCNGPDGDRLGAGGASTDVASHRGISGIVNQGNGMFLVGVFLTDAAPADPAPARLDFSGKEQFDELAPEIAQTFLIGDGMNRKYLVPSGATRLFVGFADAGMYYGPPGWYGNNGGELHVTVAFEEG